MPVVRSGGRDLAFLLNTLGQMDYTLPSEHEPHFHIFHSFLHEIFTLSLLLLVFLGLSSPEMFTEYHYMPSTRCHVLGVHDTSVLGKWGATVCCQGQGYLLTLFFGLF